MRHVIVVCTLVASAMLAVGCNFIDSTEHVCAGVGYYAVHVTVSDIYGRPQALGATVTLYDGSYVEVDSSPVGAAEFYAAEERGGRTYDIKVTKPWYTDVWVRGVHAPGGGCVTDAGDATVTVPVQLKLTAGAPRIRSLHLVPDRITMDRPPYNFYTFAFTPVIDADYGVSTAVAWRLTGDTSSVSFDPLSGTLTYKCLPQSGYLTVRATSRVDTTLFDTAQVAVQGHPASTSDPPCASP